jgi:hypothetical protein
MSCSPKHKGPMSQGSAAYREAEARGEFIPRTVREMYLGYHVETPREVQLRKLEERVTAAENRAAAAEARLERLERGNPNG